MPASQLRANPSARHQPQPQRHGQRTTHKVKPQGAGLQGGAALQAVLHKKQHQRGGNGAGNAIEHEHRQQAPKSRLPPRLPQAVGICAAVLPQRWVSRAEALDARPTSPLPTQSTATPAGQAHPRCAGKTSGRDGRQHHACQPQTFAPGHDTAALQCVAPQHGAPGLVRHGQRAVGRIGEHQPAAAHSSKACGSRSGGKNSAENPSPRHSAATAPQAKHGGSERAYSRSIRRPSSGSITASSRRAPSSTAPRRPAARPTRGRTSWASAHTAAAHKRPAASPASRSASPHASQRRS
jgi:hypothetical protein